MRFAVVTPDPAVWLHMHAFDEAAEAVSLGLAELGHAVARGYEPLADCANIVFGVHHLRESVELPARSVLFNLEQIVPGSIWLSQGYLRRLRGHPVWDYSALNIGALRELQVTQVAHVPLGHAAALERIEPAPEDIDILFYGIWTDRRRELLERLGARGWRVHATRDTYGEARDRLIGRARIVLNVHASAPARLEMARCFYLLVNGRFVLSEDCEDAGAAGLEDGMALSTYERIEERCEWYLAHAEERAAIAQAGRALMRARPQARYLEAAVARLGWA